MTFTQSKQKGSYVDYYFIIVISRHVKFGLFLVMLFTCIEI